MQLSEFVFYGLPAISPFLAALIASVGPRSGWSRWLLAVVVVGCAYAASFWLTGHAHHMRYAYDALPEISRLAVAGFIWAAVLTLPAVLAVLIPYRHTGIGALAGLGIGALAFGVLAPMNFGLMVLFSIE